MKTSSCLTLHYSDKCFQGEKLQSFYKSCSGGGPRVADQKVDVGWRRWDGGTMLPVFLTPHLNLFNSGVTMTSNPIDILATYVNTTPPLCQGGSRKSLVEAMRTIRLNCVVFF